MPVRICVYARGLILQRSKDSHKELGVGQLPNVAETREILKQGYLYKRGNARITWKKKFVCLFEHGWLYYYDNAKVCNSYKNL